MDERRLVLHSYPLCVSRVCLPLIDITGRAEAPLGPT